MAPVLNQLNLIVRDMTATVAFYRRLGLPIETPPGVWADHHVEFKFSEDLSIEFDSLGSAKIWNASAREPGGPASAIIGFSVPTREAVDELYAHMTDGGYTGAQEPYDAFWGARYAIVEDPDGNGVGIMSPSDPAMRHAWPDPAT